ncbi:hypothetical protein OPV22_009354 [Ensete ventricosum]|uniref:Uncharacterized protein n=1 Tax=Ensete ventricosum TaxID=4639 RepID=A0AAV8RD45_ENSVE|nr:hypothetical protein OPV22_009354 [Ensete ventricosum]
MPTVCSCRDHSGEHYLAGFGFPEACRPDPAFFVLRPASLDPISSCWMGLIRTQKRGEGLMRAFTRNFLPEPSTARKSLGIYTH